MDSDWREIFWVWIGVWVAPSDVSGIICVEATVSVGPVWICVVVSFGAVAQPEIVIANMRANTVKYQYLISISQFFLAYTT